MLRYSPSTDSSLVWCSR